MYAKDPYEAKFQFLINKHKKVGLNHYNDPKAFIEYLNDMHNAYKVIHEYNPGNECKVFIVLDDMIAYMMTIFQR